MQKKANQTSNCLKKINILKRINDIDKTINAFNFGSL